ncbi:hypothetical protein X899_6017 [Burkholderia pseudomallei TSV 25]|nr:hypothetical protein X899_6017 [Burkholderia pseudomallei TSV 25]
MVVPLTGCLCAVVPSDSAARARQTQKGPRPIARCAALPFFGECASLRRLVRLESLLQRGIHPRLPASAGRFEGVEHVIVEPNRRRGFVTAERPPRPAADQAVADVLVRPLKKFVGQLRRVVRINPIGVRSACSRSFAFLMLIMRGASPRGVQTITIMRPSSVPTVM